MNRNEQIDKALKDILKDVDCAKRNKQCDIDYFLSSIEKCAKAALAMPKRNCDRFGTDNAEASLAYEELCEKSETKESVNDAIAWLLAISAAEGGAE